MCGAPGLSECGLWTSITGLTWEPVREAALDPTH